MTGPYELNAIKDRLTAIEGIQQEILEELRRLTATAEIVDITNERQLQLQPNFPAANQPEEGDQAQPETKTAETTAAAPETGGETTGETAGNTKTVGQTRIGAAE